MDGFTSAQQLAAYNNVVARMAELESENEALRRKLASFQWQPIETAPKDGANVLVFDSQCGVQVGYLRYFNLHWNISPQWCSSFGEVRLHPHHWMPLPAPPKEADNA